MTAHGTNVYLDFGVRKPHAVLLGNSAEVITTRDLASLNLNQCAIYLERGCPRMELSRIAKDNRVFLIDGILVKARREMLGLRKSDANDVRLIRELAESTPGAFGELTIREKEELKSRMSYDYYSKLTRLIGSLKNRQKSFQKEFGHELPELKTLVAALEIKKSEAARCFETYVEDARGLGIRGIGPRYIGGILITASPNRFPSMSAYLVYCGLKEVSIRSGKYSRAARALYHQIGTSVIIHKDPAFYALYRKLKNDLKARFPEDSAGRIEARARNRLSTFLAKRIYGRFHPNEVCAPPGRDAICATRTEPVNRPPRMAAARL